MAENRNEKHNDAIHITHVDKLPEPKYQSIYRHTIEKFVANASKDPLVLVEIDGKTSKQIRAGLLMMLKNMRAKKPDYAQNVSVVSRGEKNIYLLFTRPLDKNLRYDTL